MEAGQMAEAERLFREGFQNGEKKCAYGLFAVCTQTGDEKGLEEARAALRDALPDLIRIADEGDADACFLIGRCYETGCGGTKDPERMIRYYVKAAEAGNTDALYNLGCFLMSRPGQEEDALRFYFIPAAEKGNPDARQALIHYYRTRNDAESADRWARLLREPDRPAE